MFSGLRAAGARAIWRAGLLLPFQGEDNQEESAQDLFFQEVRRLTDDPATQDEIFNRLKADDGKVSFRSVGDALQDPGRLGIQDPLLQKVLGGFWSDIVCEMQLGAFNENWRDQEGILVVTREEDSENLMSLGGLRDLTGTLVTDTELKVRLLKILRDAHQAEVRPSRGRDKNTLLLQYIVEVQQAGGQKISVLSAEILIGLAQDLID